VDERQNVNGEIRALRGGKIHATCLEREFAMGHAIDDLNYNKVFFDAGYVWSELKKIYGPIAVTEDKLASRDRQIQQLRQENLDLKARLDRLEAISVERLVLAARSERRLGERRRKTS
jgi:hypothetical protein